MKTHDLNNSELTTIDLGTLHHVTGAGGYSLRDIFGKATEGAIGGFLATPGDWRSRLVGAAGGAWSGGSGEFDRETAEHAARKAERQKMIAAAG
jgi:hypothetical protein